MTSLATAGTLGAISFGTTATLLSDSESFRANLLSSGELNHELCWEPSDAEIECTTASDVAAIDLGSVEPGDSGSVTLRHDIIDNPGWLWLRTNCPEGPCGLERVVDVTLWYDQDCDGVRDDPADAPAEPAVTVDGTPIENVSLCEAMDALQQGVLLDGDPETDPIDPVQSDEDICLGFEWSIDENALLCRDEELTLTFDFYTEQWRHNQNPTRPETWTDEPCAVDCDVTAEECCPTFQEISFVAFCTEADGIEANQITFTPHYDVAGNPFKVEWESAVDLSWIVLFYASKFENFDVSGETDGTIVVGEGDELLEWDGGQSTTTRGQRPTSPCPTDASCGVRYEFGEDVWNDVCDGGGG